MNSLTPSPAEVSRRRFLAQMSAAGSLVLMAKVTDAQTTAVADATATDADIFNPDLFVAITPDGAVTIVAHRSEMGTGIRTALPRVVADELEADWERVTIDQAPGDNRLGDQNTDGSNSIRFFFSRMRVAGASARTMLEQAAALKWKVPASQCQAKNHRVHDTKSNRSLGYGDLVSIARTLDVPDPKSVKLKDRKDWKYIGKDVPVVDLDDILTGKAVYGIDARMDNQVFAVIARPPVVGGKVKSFNDSRTRKMPGVIDVVQIDGFNIVPGFSPLGGVAVLADSTWNAWQGRDALEIEWDHGANASYNSDEYAAALKESVSKPGQSMREHGNADAELEKSRAVISADYFVPHLSHAPMETPCAVADVQTNASGRVTSCHVLTCTQNPQAVQQAVGPAMGMNPKDVLVNVTLLGSGFGRKSKPDYCVEAAVLSRQFGRPVHVTWTRSDDIQHDYYHTVSAIRVDAAVDDRGRPTVWRQRAAYPTIGSTFAGPAARSPQPWEIEMGSSDLPFDVPNISVEACQAPAQTRIGWLRSVCHIQQNFAVGSFADELAHAAGRDPLEFLLELLGDDRHIDLGWAKMGNRGASADDYPYDIGRLKNVTRRAAELANWSRHRSLPKGRGLGIACARAFLGYTGHVVEVEVDKDGTVHIPKVWAVLDCGTVVSPDRVTAQVEGAAIMATTHTRYGEITFTNGVADQDNYDSFQMAKMADAPREIHVELVKSNAIPAGVGETTVPSFAPAFCNAIFAATGKRIRELPLSRHDLSWG